MTVRDIAEIAGVSVQTVRRTAENNVGYVFEKGKTANFTEKESIEIMRELKKKGFIQPVQNGQEPVQNVEVVTKSDMAAFGVSIVQEMMRQFIPLLQNRPQQIEFVQDYYTIKGYASKLGIQITISDAINIGRQASKLSRERGFEIKKADDERFGIVNSYSIEVLKEVFSI